jgi:hypothetical protein
MTRYLLVRRLLIGLAVLAGIVLAASLGLRIVGAAQLRAASARFERDFGPLDLLGFVRPKLPPEKNAVTWLRPGVLAVVLFSDDRAVVGTLASKPPSAWTPEDLAALEPILERNAPAIQILGRAPGLPHSNWDVSYEKASAAKLPDLLAAMNAGKLVSARGRLAVLRGDREAALQSVEILGSLAASYEREPMLIILLIGSALERYQLGLVRELVTDPRVDAATLDRIERSLIDTDLRRTFRDTLRGEAAAIIEDVHGGAYWRELPRVVPRSLAIGLADLMMASALESRRNVEPTLQGPFTAPIVDTNKELEGAGWWRRLTSAYAFNIASAAARGTGTESARRLARMAIELRRHALATGSYPTAFEPPIDPTSGAPFAVTATEAGVEVRSSSSLDILKSVFPVGSPLTEQVFSWTLPPAASRSTTPSRSPAARTGASS